MTTPEHASKKPKPNYTPKFITFCKGACSYDCQIGRVWFSLTKFKYWRKVYSFRYPDGFIKIAPKD